MSCYFKIHIDNLKGPYVSKILVAVDRSTVSEHVYQEAFSLAKTLDAAMLLLHVLSPMEEGYPMPVYPAPDSVYPGNDEAIRIFAQQWKDFEQKGLDVLQAYNARALEAGLISEFSQRSGDPGHVICKTAREWGLT